LSFVAVPTSSGRLASDPPDPIPRLADGLWRSKTRSQASIAEIIGQIEETVVTSLVNR
jgi:hypothetical protein